MFEILEDTLDLSKLLYPDFLKLIQYPEYKFPVLKLFADMIVKKKISTGYWINSKSDLLREAQIELKRYNSENTPKTSHDILDYEVPEENDKENITSSLPWDDINGPHELACFTVIFASSYSDNDSKQFVDKVFKTGHRGLIFSAAITQYRMGQTVNDTIWNWLAADNNSRMHFCDWLEETKDTVLYPRKYYNQRDMSISWLMEVVNDIKEDSIQFIGKKYVTNVYRSGYLYFYKYKVKNHDEWILNYVGVQSSDTTKMLSDFDYYEYSGIPLNNNTVAEINDQIKEVCTSIRLKGRKRVSYSRNLYSNGMEDDY